MNSLLDLLAASYNGIITCVWFLPPLLLYATVFVCTFGPVVWLIIIVPPWSSVIHPMLGQVTIVDQHSVGMFCVRSVGLLVALQFLQLEANRAATGDRLARRSMWIQLVGMLLAIPPFIKTYMF